MEELNSWNQMVALLAVATGQNGLASVRHCDTGRPGRSLPGRTSKANSSVIRSVDPAVGQALIKATARTASRPASKSDPDAAAGKPAKPSRDTHACVASVAALPDSQAPSHRTMITAIEPQNDASMLVSWCDPTMCHYVDQVWISVTARSGGYCALTGNRIRRGDSIFKPRSRGAHRPVNCNEMILAAALASEVADG
ncbi:DUF3331 domain-containing protein [Paraburkholderia sp.]|uniref:DUF3331 domain-containing protein n=1 Tax=Paraburkholderia sp. TaxID=1926495 RepID=UPI0023A4C9D9|nr:DUF3331 domain-containing protein [Paraburkholderia sp.]MDE1183749.1 DUF3331 domain-containing protein [Paraburkholderia sp.]